MLEELFKLVKGSATESVINNPDIPNEENDEVVAEATNTVASGLQNMAAGGGLESILSLFGKGGDQQSLLNNPIVSMMKGHFISKLTGKYNMESNQAGAVANNLIPDVLSKLVNKTNDPNNSSFDINSIIGSLTGGATNQQSGGGGFDFQNIISKFTSGGLDANHDGKVGLDDIISKVTGGAQQQVRQQNSNSGGGLMDMIQRFLK